MEAQALLQKAWTEGRHGRMPAWSQAKAWALREVWRDVGKGDHGLASYVAGKVTKAGGGHPSGEAIIQFSPGSTKTPLGFQARASTGACKGRSAHDSRAARLRVACRRALASPHPSPWIAVDRGPVVEVSRAARSSSRHGGSAGAVHGDQ